MIQDKSKFGWVHLGTILLYRSYKWSMANDFWSILAAPIVVVFATSRSKAKQIEEMSQRHHQFLRSLLFSAVVLKLAKHSRYLKSRHWLVCLKFDFFFFNMRHVLAFFNMKHVFAFLGLMDLHQTNVPFVAAGGWLPSVQKLLERCQSRAKITHT